MTEQTHLPTLYKKNSNGKLQHWTVRADWLGTPGTNANLGIIVTRWGQVDGETQETRDVIMEGKNAGKKNATTPFQQAELEAKSKWEKQLKKGYVKTLAEAEAGKVDEIIEGGVSPMLAHRYDEQGHKIQYPAFAQPKLDGHRCIAVIKDGKASLWSRTRKPIVSMPHLNRALESLSDKIGAPDIEMVFDGELYNHLYRDKFETLTSLIRQDVPKPGHEVVEYHIYDLFWPTMPDCDQWQRYQDLGIIFTEQTEPCLVRTNTRFVKDEDELMLSFEDFVSEGYEGAMVRNLAGKYVNKRSYDLQKVKEFQDAEFEVVGVEEGRGKLAGHAIFVCQNAEDSQTFRAKMKGDTAALKRYFEHPELAIGKMLTVKFQGYTNKAGVPRFPVALRFREDL